MSELWNFVVRAVLNILNYNISVYTLVCSCILMYLFQNVGVSLWITLLISIPLMVIGSILETVYLSYKYAEELDFADEPIEEDDE